HHEVEPLTENDGAFLGGAGGPGLEGTVSGFNSVAGVRAVGFGDVGDDFAGLGGFGVGSRNPGRLGPLAVDVAGFAEEPHVFEMCRSDRVRRGTGHKTPRVSNISGAEAPY